MTRATDAAIERACEVVNARCVNALAWTPDCYDTVTVFTAYADHIQSINDALRANFGNDVPASLAGYVLPVVVDPIVQMVREGVVTQFERNGWLIPDQVEDTAAYQVALSVARAIAAQGGEA